MQNPTPITVSRRVRNLILAGVLLLGLLTMWAAPTVPIIAVGGFALALIMSYPVRGLTNFMPRGLAIAASFLVLLGVIVFGIGILIPIVAQQLGALISAVPQIVAAAESLFNNTLMFLEERGLLPGDPQSVISDIGNEVITQAQSVAQGLLGGVFGFISGAFSIGIALFGIVFVAVYLLVDVRRMKAIYLNTMPHSYRRDARDLWNAFGFSLSRYFSGLLVILLIQGVLSGVALFFLGVPYAVVLGAWVSLTAIIPYLGAWLGAIPALIVAAVFVSPATAALVGLFFFAIQQLESNLLTPRIQGQAVKAHPILILLAVIAGTEIAGLAGAILAVPAVAVVRVIFDFFRVRLKTRER